MASRDPDALQREVEQTRAELAAAVDAIADRVSPRRAAVRGASRVRSVVVSVRGTQNGQLAALETPGRTPLPLTTGSARRIRTERVAVAAGAAGVLLLVLVLVARSRRAGEG